MSESVYIHGTAAEEQRRLSLLNDVLLNNASLREMALHGHERIIDFGSGLGQFTRAMARAVPRGHVVGIERNEEQLAGATRLAAAEDEAKLVEFRRGDVLNLELPRAEWGSFDVAHARFILEHVPDGNDPYVGRRLVSLLHEGGAIPKRNTWIFFGGCAGMEIFPVLTANMAGVVRSAREAIISMSLFDAMAFDRVMEQYEEWSRRPDAAIWFSVSWAEGARP